MKEKIAALGEINFFYVVALLILGCLQLGLIVMNWKRQRQDI